jgi:glutaryl-CoA dehydrogenase
LASAVEVAVTRAVLAVRPVGWVVAGRKSARSGGVQLMAHVTTNVREDRAVRWATFSISPPCLARHAGAKFVVTRILPGIDVPAAFCHPPPASMATNPSTPASLADLSALDGLLTEDERLVRDTVRRFVKERYLPRAASLFAEEKFPTDLIPSIGELGLLGASLTGYGCAGMSAVTYALALAELEYGDSGLRSFASVQGSLAMYPIWRYGSEEQKQRFLPKMATGEAIGCFGLTEPDSGSDPGSMVTRAKRDGDDYVLSGTKMWITNAPLCHLAVVWAKVDDGDASSIRGFVVERGMAGFSTPTIHGKMSLRASATGEIVLDGCRVPKANLLEGARGLGGPLACLNQARFGISYAVLGAARSCFETAQTYAMNRVQFGKPIASKQLIQEHFADMAQELVKAEVTTLHFARLKDQGLLTPTQVSLVKRSNVALALDVARRCRGILGGNGILLDYPVIRHALNLESVFTYEGTHEVHTLILGKALTTFDAF